MWPGRARAPQAPNTAGGGSVAASKMRFSRSGYPGTRHPGTARSCYGGARRTHVPASTPPPFRHLSGSERPCRSGGDVLPFLFYKYAVGLVQFALSAGCHPPRWPPSYERPEHAHHVCAPSVVCGSGWVLAPHRAPPHVGARTRSICVRVARSAMAGRAAHQSQSAEPPP